jgi:uncharacterized glyoxalase superfamily protein PhnB
MTTQTLYSGLSYVDAPAAIAWLERAFGIAAEQIYPGEPGTIAHAQLRAGRDLLMLGTARSDDFGKRTSPRALGGIGTTALYLHVDDIEALYAKANAARATIVRPLGDTSYDDSKTFTTEDCEGYVWSFGTYAVSPEVDVSPCLRYADAHAAIAWLRDACGFEEKLVVPGDDGTIAHAELSLGTGVLMVGSRRDDDLRFDTPDRTAATTGGVYAYVADPDALFSRVSLNGARIIHPLNDTDYGSREFGIADPEGNRFSFGTYRP